MTRFALDLLLLTVGDPLSMKTTGLLWAVEDVLLSMVSYLSIFLLF